MARAVRETHAGVDVALEAVEDLLDGLDVGLQVPGVLRHAGQRRGQHRLQVEAQQAVHGLARKGTLGWEAVR